MVAQGATKPDLAEQVVPKTYFGQLGAGGPSDFWGGSRAGSCLGVALAAWAVSGGQALILAASIYPEEELQQCQPAAPGSSSLFTQPLEFLLELGGSRDTAQCLLLCFPALLTQGIWDSVGSLGVRHQLGWGAALA